MQVFEKKLMRRHRKSIGKKVQLSGQPHKSIFLHLQTKQKTNRLYRTAHWQYGSRRRQEREGLSSFAEVSLQKGIRSQQLTYEYRPSNPGAKKGARVIKPKKASLIRKNKLVKVSLVQVYLISSSRLL